MGASKIYYVAPEGSGDGSSFTEAMSFDAALSAVGAGEMILLEPGIYTIPYTGSKNTITLEKSGRSGAPIKMAAANCGRARFDFSTPADEYVDKGFGFHLTGNYWYIKNIDVTRAGYHGMYIGAGSTSEASPNVGQHNTIENSAFFDNRNTGLEINNGGAYNTIVNSDAYLNYDLKRNGGMADGFAPKQLQGMGNRFYGCRAWGNSDDGFDTYDSPHPVIIENSWAFSNGYDVWGFGLQGNGNGFKLGGNGKLQHNVITNSVAFDHPKVGFDLNGNTGGIRVLNNVAYANGQNFGLDNALASGEKHFVRNNISLNGPDDIRNADAAYNSWDTSVSTSAEDFISVELSLAKAPRNPDGNLPDSGLFRLKADSDLIDAGIDVGLPYDGNAPDLGAFERE